MPVDPQKPRRILVVHGVQTGTNEDQDQQEQEFLHGRTVFEGFWAIP